MSNIDWTSRADFIRGKVKEGLSDNDIAALIPGASKSAVGAARRRFDIPTNYAPSLRERVATKGGKKKPTSKPSLAPAKPSPATVRTAPAEIPASASSGPLGKAFVPEPGAKLVPFESLRSIGSVRGTCRWPYEIDGETLYCGAATEKSFCPVHTKMAYTPASIIAAEQERARREKTPSYTVPVAEVSRAQKFILSLRGAGC